MQKIFEVIAEGTFWLALAFGALYISDRLFGARRMK